MNTVFIPELDHEDFVLQRQHELGSPDVVSLREGLGTTGTPYNGLYREAPPERGSIFTLQVYKGVGISQVEVYKRVGKLVI